MKTSSIVIATFLVTTFLSASLWYFSDQSIKIDYSQKIEKLVKAGNYKDVFIHLSDYPLAKKSGTDQVVVKLFSFDCRSNVYPTREILQKIDDRGYRPADLYELLSYKLQNPKPGKNILALGSVSESSSHPYRKYSPYIQLFVDENNQLKYRLSEAHEWMGNYICDGEEVEFLAVSK